MTDNIYLGSCIAPLNLFNTKNRLNSNQRWIDWGEDNLLPQRIIWILENCTTQSAITNKIARDVAGFSVQIKDPKRIKNRYNLQYPTLPDFLESLAYERGISSLIYRLAYDLAAFGGFATLVSFVPGSNIVRDIFYQDFSQIRRGFEYSDNLYYQKYIVNTDWERYQYQYDKMIEYSPLNKEVLENGSDETLIDYYYRDTCGREWYPLPAWWAAYRNCLIDVEANIFIHSQMTNGFFPGGLLEIPDGLSPDTEKELRESLKEGLKGAAKAGKALLLKRQGDKAINWTPLETNFDVEKVTDLITENKQQIITANGVTSKVLLGMEGGASLGGDGKTIESAALDFYYKVIMPAREEILRRLNKLIWYAGYDTEIEIIDEYTKKINNPAETDESTTN